jgi:TetR/AcrR family transcriptional regulator, tetracycline repressor protein
VAGREAGRDALNPERVLDAAMVAVERDGVAALSMRGLATELGVRSPTIYWHVGNRDELLNRLIDRMSDELGNIEPTGTDPVERIASICTALLAETRRRPHLVELSRGQGRSEFLFAKAQELIAHELIACGLHGAEAAFALAAILYHLGGFVLLEQAVSSDFRLRGASHWESDEGRELGAHLQGVVDVDAVFDTTLRAVLDALLVERRARHEVAT